MVQAGNRHKINLNFEHFKVVMGLDPGLQPVHQMTGLRFAIDQMKELSEVRDIKLMFDEMNPTTEEEILEQGIEEVLVKAVNMADLARFQASVPVESDSPGLSLAEMVL